MNKLFFCGKILYFKYIFFTINNFFFMVKSLLLDKNHQKYMEQIFIGRTEEKEILKDALEIL